MGQAIVRIENSNCYCYEKFKAHLPKDFKPKCFRERCQNWRTHQKEGKTVVKQTKYLKSDNNTL